MYIYLFYYTIKNRKCHYLFKKYLEKINSPLKRELFIIMF